MEPQTMAQSVSMGLEALPHERLQLWPVWIGIGFPLLLVGLEATPIATDFVFVMIGIPALLLAGAILAFWAAVLAVRCLSHRAWRRGLISAVLPLIALAAGTHPLAFIRFCNNSGDVIHFYVRRPVYMAAVNATPAGEQPRLLTFNLGGMIWASRGYVYDESDEVMKTPSMQTPAWKARASDSELGCGYGAVPIAGPSFLTKHWYIASFAC
jgi:hypothetical protein